MNSLTEENYLKALFHLGEKGGVNVKDLSKDLDIKMPTVTSMMKKLATKGLVNYESYKPVQLTVKGKKAAASIIRKHRLTEMYLVEKMGFGWEEVHEIAEQIEHVHAPSFFNKMDELLGFPKVDPHGSPIPDQVGNMTMKVMMKLSDCQAGEEFTIKAVVHSADEFLSFLNQKELSLDTVLTIIEVESFDGSMKVSYGNRTEVLSKVVCERLLGS